MHPVFSSLYMKVTDIYFESQFKVSYQLIVVHLFFHESNFKWSKVETSWASHSPPAHLAYLSKCSAIYKQIEIVFHLQKDLGCLPLTNRNKATSVYNKIEVVFHYKIIEVVFHLQKDLG